MPQKPKKSQRSQHSQQSPQVGTVIKRKQKYYAKLTEGDRTTEILIHDYQQTHHGPFALRVENQLYVCAPGKRTRPLLKPDDKNCILHKGKQFMLQFTPNKCRVIRVLSKV